jgi:hypothetical protein
MSAHFMTESFGAFASVIPIVSAAALLLAARACSRRQSPVGVALAIFLIVWYAAAVYLSITYNGFVSSPIGWTRGKDFQGFVVFAALQFVPIYNYHIVYMNVPQLRHFMLHEVPSWGLIGFQVYRLVGACYLYMYENGTMVNFFSLHAGFLETLVGITALPLSITVCHCGGVKKFRVPVLLWNSLGLYSLMSAYGAYFASYFGYIDVSLSLFAFFPMSLIKLFQDPLALAIHFFFLTCADKMDFDIGQEDKKL